MGEFTLIGMDSKDTTTQVGAFHKQLDIESEAALVITMQSTTPVYNPSPLLPRYAVQDCEIFTRGLT